MIVEYEKKLPDGRTYHATLEIQGSAENLDALYAIAKAMRIEVTAKDARFEAMRENWDAGLRGYELKNAIFLATSGATDEATNQIEHSPDAGPALARPAGEDRRRPGDARRDGVRDREAGHAAEAEVGRSGAARQGPDAVVRDRGEAPSIFASDDGARIPLGVETEARVVGVRETSRDAYHRASAYGKLTAQQKLIVDWLSARIGDATRQEVARGTGIGINAVCGRVNELLADGVLRETKKRKCRVTGETANALTLKGERL